jgi:hypothetical protein
LAAVSGLETLPPDQRAVLQLILVQGRGYADLASMLQLDVAAVRDRAVAALDALGDAVPPARTAPDTAQRARIADYLLGQQDAGQRIVTFAELGESADACRWAQVLRERLAPIASAPLPEVPASTTPSPNGSAPGPVAPVPAATVAAVAPPAAGPAATAAAPATPAAPAVAAATPPAAAPPSTGSPASRPASRLGGAILLAGVAALVIVLAIVLFTGGGDDGGSSSAASTTPTQTQARTQPTNTSTAPASAANIFGQVNLVATPAGGQAVGVGLIQRSGSKSILALEAQKLPANGAQDIYAVWLQGNPGSHFLGFVPRQVKANGTFTVSADVPSNVRSYATVLVTRESTAATPTQPGPTILTGPLKFR